MISPGGEEALKELMSTVREHLIRHSAARGVKEGGREGETQVHRDHGEGGEDKLTSSFRFVLRHDSTAKSNNNNSNRPRRNKQNNK